MHRENVLRQDRQMSFQCRHCDENFLQYSDLIEHIDRNHPLNQYGGRDIARRDLNKTTPIQSTSKSEMQLIHVETGDSTD